MTFHDLVNRFLNRPPSGTQNIDSVVPDSLLSLATQVPNSAPLLPSLLIN